MGRAMLRKYLIQFSVEGQGCVPSLLFDLRPNYGGGKEDNGDLLQRSHAGTAALTAPSPAGHQDGGVMVESSDKTWSTGERNAKLLQYSCCKNPMNSMKRKKDRTLKMNPSDW